MHEGIFDEKNGVPMNGTSDWNLLQRKKIEVMENAVKKCSLNIDDDFCEYKETFNYCIICNKEFRRER